jgi:hypothetical protein
MPTIARVASSMPKMMTLRVGAKRHQPAGAVVGHPAHALGNIDWARSTALELYRGSFATRYQRP